MTRRVTFVTLALTAVVAFLVGAIVAGGFLRPVVVAEAPLKRAAVAATDTRISAPRSSLSPLVNFADVVERVNPAVVNIDATTSGSREYQRRRRSGLPDPPELFENPRNNAPRRG